MALGVAVTWHTRPGTDERIHRILAEMALRTRAEPGCLIYQPHRSIDQPDVYYIYEQFVDEDAFAAHRESDHYRRLILEDAVVLLEARQRDVYSTRGFE